MQLYSERVEILFSFAFHSEITFSNSLYKCDSWLQEGAEKVNSWSYTAVILYNFVIAPAVEPAVAALQNTFHGHC